MIKTPEIIFEDSNFLVINKPAGLNVHSDGKHEEYTLADWLIEKYPDIKNVGEPMVTNDMEKGILDIYFGPGEPQIKTVIFRPGIVHRLDKDTTGVMVIAKNQETFLFFKQQFKNHEIEKTYLALVYGNFREDDGEINRPIGRSGKDFRQKSSASNAKGTLREAITEYKILERFKTSDKSLGDLSLIEVRPKTGRMHQIRVHMKFISHPIVCDKLYAPGRPCAGSLTHQALHAQKISLKIPEGDTREFTADLPADFASTLEELRAL